MFNNQNRRYYFLQVKEDFFQSEDLLLIQDAAPEGLSNIYSLLYLKLLLKSLSTDGYLRKPEGPYTANALRIAINFVLKSKQEDTEIMDQFIQSLVELGLVKILKDKTIFLTRVRSMVKSKTEAADAMAELRATRKELENELNEITATIDEDYYRQFEYSWYTLFLRGIVDSSNRGDFQKIFKELVEDSYKPVEILEAVSYFSERAKDWREIADKGNYIKVSLKNIIDDYRRKGKVEDPAEEDRLVKIASYNWLEKVK